MTGAVKYQFQLSTSSSFTSFVISDSTITDTTKGMGTLAYGTTYYIQVRTKGTSGWGGYGTTLQFSTTGSTAPALIAAPTIISPVSGQLISPLGWTAVWRKVSTAVKYQFQLSTSSSFTTLLISDSTRTDTTKGMGTLAFNTTFYIRVRSKNSTAWGNYGSTIPFTTSSSSALVATGVGEQLSPTPTEFTLAQNYPNPFNPTTVIRFSVPVGSYVNLTVYNSLGEEVRTLVDGVREAGYYETSFDGTGLASGIYFYRIRAGSFIATRKLLLMK